MNERVQKALNALFQSEDANGCSDDLTVVSATVVAELKAAYNDLVGYKAW